MRRIARRRWLTPTLVLLLAGRGFPQGDQQNAALIVIGHPGQVPITQINGRPYVAVDALARLMSGALGYQRQSDHIDVAAGERGADSFSRRPVCESGTVPEIF